MKIPWMRGLPGLVLSALIGQGLMASPDPDPPLQGEAAAVPDLPPEPQYLPPELAAFAAVAERPLFLASRRPPPVAARPPDKPAEVKRIDMVLAGVLHVGDSRTAFLQESKGGRTLRLKEGQAVEGWQVVRIEPRKLVLAQGGREQEPLLREIVAVKPPVQPAKQMAANTPQPAAPARGK